MTLQDRDKKILMAIVPLVVVLGFWFLVLAPKRAESGRLGEELTKIEAKRDTAVAEAGKLQGARNSYADDYATVVRLGKAVPASLDMPSLLVQLESAAKGTNIDFDSVKAGARTSASAPAAGSSGGSSGSSSAPPAAAGGAPAQTGAGKATEKAGDAKATSDQRSSASSSASSGSAANTGGAAPASGAPATGAQAPGLDSVPLEFTFTGGFFDLADFFHRMKRFVRLANDKIKVHGRLITIDSLDFTTDTFPELSASVKATVYLSPKDQGTTAGATPAGPQTAQASAPTGSSTATQSTAGAP